MVGTIIKYSSILYSGVSLPVVEYIVNGQKYLVVGPRFKSVIQSSFSSPFNKTESSVTSNLTTREELPETLKLKIRSNSFVSFTKSPLMDLYPIDSKIDVYYNPNKPKMAYVQRYVKPGRFFYTFILIIGIALAVLGFYIMFCLKLKA